MLANQRQARREEIARKTEQYRKNHNLDALPAFLNMLTDWMIDTEEQFEHLRKDMEHVKKRVKNG